MIKCSVGHTGRLKYLMLMSRPARYSDGQGPYPRIRLSRYSTQRPDFRFQQALPCDRERRVQKPEEDGFGGRTEEEVEVIASSDARRRYNSLGWSGQNVVFVTS